MSCAFCPYSYQTRAKGRLHFDLLRKIVDEVVEKKITRLIEVTGYGEPLLNPDWLPLSRFIIDSGIRLNLTTNGTLLTEATSAELSGMDLEDIIISLQTPDAQSFKIRKAAIHFDSYLARLKRFIEIHARSRSKSRIRIRLLNTSRTKRMAFPEAVSVLNSRREVIASIKEWVGIICGLTGHPYNEKLISKGLNRVPALRPAAIRVTENVTLESSLCNDYWSFGTGNPLLHPAKIARCRSLTRESALVYHDGEVSLCCSDFDNHLNIGSLKGQTLLQALGSAKADSLVEGFRRFRVKHPYCQHCLGGNSLWLTASKALASSVYMLNLGEFLKIDLCAC
jgi:organic radical activating enzyme